MANELQSKAYLGTISHGTLRTVDLLTSFANELERLDANSDNAHYRNLISAANAYAFVMQEGDQQQTDFLSDDGNNMAPELVNELFDALNEFAPDYCYFGANEGDGSDFGFWPHADFQQMMKDDDVPQISDLSDLADDYAGPALHISDHGNATFYAVENGNAREVWSIV